MADIFPEYLKRETVLQTIRGFNDRLEFDTMEDICLSINRLPAEPAKITFSDGEKRISLSARAATLLYTYPEAVEMLADRLGKAIDETVLRGGDCTPYG